MTERQMAQMIERRKRNEEAAAKAMLPALKGFRMDEHNRRGAGMAGDVRPTLRAHEADRIAAALRMEAVPRIPRKKRALTVAQKARQYARMKERMKEDVGFRITCALRSRITMAVRAQRTRKAARTEALIGCCVDQLKVYLASKFAPGMTWENYGEWHIDHIRPCCSFDLTDSAQQLACFHYTNLQPLWAVDNLRKGGRQYAQHGPSLVI